MERARSARAACKQKNCKEKIAKGELRIGKIRVDASRDITFTSWYHVECFALTGGGCPRTAKTADEFESNHLDAAAVKDDLGDDLYAKFKEQLAASFDMKARKISKRGEEPEPAGSPAKKKIKTTPTLPDGSPIDIKIIQKYDMLTVPQLKDYLRFNRQVIGGTKSELLLRCCVGEAIGCLPRCPVCNSGGNDRRSSLRQTGMNIFCAGYYEEGVGRMDCGFRCKEGGVVRVPWVNSQEEADAAASVADKNEEQKAGAAAAGVPEEAIRADAHPRDAAAAILKAAQEAGIDMPSNEDEARRKCGMTWFEFKGAEDAATKIMAQLMKEFGSRKAKAAQAEAAAKVCGHPDNAALAACFDEIAVLQVKAGQPGFKVKASRKAADAIRGLDFKITDGKLLTKKKTKVAGIGKSTAEKIDEFLSTGKIEKLEMLREEHG